MLHAYPSMLDIDVNHWRNLQALILESAKEKRRIIVIHERGELLKLVHSRREEIVGTVERVDDPHTVAEQLYRDNAGRVDFVAVFERSAVDDWAARFQDTWRSDEDLDVFVRRQYALLDSYPDGIVTFPGPARSTLGLQWRVGASYEAVARAAGAFVPGGSAVVFGIFDGEALWATLVLRFDADHRVDVVTTVDPSQLKLRGGRREVAGEVVRWVEETYGACSIGLFAGLDSARSFLAQADKVGAIRDIAAKGDLIAERLPAALAAIIGPA